MIRPRSRSVPVFVALVVAAFIIVSASIGSREGIWLDEAYTLHTTGSSLATAFHEAIAFELQPPLYFCLLTAWRSIDGSDFFARFFSTLCAAGTLVAVALFTKRHLKTVNPAAATLVVAVNPLLLWSSQEIRVYAFAIFLSAVFMSCFFRAYVSDESPAAPAARAGAIGTAIAALYTQYFLVFLLVGAGAAVLFVRRSSARRFFLDMGAVALAALPILAVVIAQVAGTAGPSGSFKFDVYEFVSTLGDFVAPHRWAKDLPFHKPFSIAYAVLLFGALGAGLYRARAGASAPSAILITIVATIAACFSFVMLFFPSVLQFPRHVVALFVPLQLLVLAVFAATPVHMRRRIIAAFLICQLALDVPADATRYAGFEKPGHWPRVAAYLERSVASHDTILVYNADLLLPLEHYYRGPGRAVPIPRPLHYDRYELRDYTTVMPADMARIVGSIGPASGSVWFVAPSHPEAVYARGFQVVTGALSARYRTVDARHFGDITVERLVAV